MRKSHFKKAANCFAGRVLRRLLGEEKGVAMLEYVLLGLLIAAAVIALVTAFGNSIGGMFGVLSQSATNQQKTAELSLKTTQGEAKTNIDTGKKYQNKINSDSEVKQSENSGSGGAGGAGGAGGGDQG